MPGIINTQLDTTKDSLAPDDPNQVKTVGAAGYDPSLRTVDPNQTVSGQLNKVLASDSPLVTQARQQTVEQANARGLQNSSMAVGAGESAAIGAALPIASADANVYGQVAQQNVEAQNTASQFGAGAVNRAGEVSAGAVNTAQQIKEQQAAQTGLIAAQTAGRVCFAIELDPLYVDIGIRRWQAFTGEVATLLADGRTFDAVAAQRCGPPKTNASS